MARRGVERNNRGTYSGAAAELIQYRRDVARHLAEILPVLARASIGDFSKDVPKHRSEDEFSEMYVGLQVMIDVIRETVGELEGTNQQLESLIQKRTAVLNEAQRMASVGSWEWIVDTNTVYWSDELCRLAGRSMKHFRTNFTEFVSYVHPADRKRIRELIRATSRSKQTFSAEYRIVRRDGAERHVQGRGRVVSFGGGKEIRMLGTTHDITDRREAEIARSRLAMIVESSDDAVISTTLDGTVTSWNPGAERIYGYAAREAVGNPIDRLIPDDRPGERESIFEAVIRNKRVGYYETKRETKGGRWIDVSLTVSPLRDADDNVIGVASISRDVTDQKELALRQQQFVSIASHELRTPITALIGYLTLIKNEDNVGEEQKERFFERALQSAHRLAELVEDLLHVARIEEERLAFKMARLNPSSILETVAEHHRQSVNQKQHRLVVRNHLAPGVRIRADRSKLRQILDNLITNAIKYTPAGGTITLSAKSVGDSVSVSVTDTGIGIHPDNLKRIYDKFFREYTELSVMAGGTGLGLFITKQLVDRQGGRLSISSKQGRGTTATIKFPVSGKRPAAEK